MSRIHKPATLAATAVLALTIAGCSGKAADPEASASKGLKTGPGVTADAINLGVLTALSGPGAVLGKPALEGGQVILKQVNDAGGVCHRKVTFTVRDHAFDPQRAVTAFNEIQPDLAAMAQLIGSAPTAALIDNIEQDHLATVEGGFSADLLGYQHLVIPGATYDINMVNGVTWVAGQAHLTAGDKIGAVYLEGEAGSNALKGAKFAADKLGLKVVEQQVSASATDLTAQVSALRAAGVKAVVMTALPSALGSFVGVAAATGMNVPIVADSVGYVRQMLDTPIAPALENNVHLVSSQPASASGDEGVKAFLTAYKAQFPQGTADQATVTGAIMTKISVAALQKACDGGDLTREGITRAVRSLSKFDSGLGMTFDFTDAGVPSSKITYLQQPSRKAEGGVTDLQTLSVPEIDEYLASKG